jgi:carbonic anhydrase
MELSLSNCLVGRCVAAILGALVLSTGCASAPTAPQSAAPTKATEAVSADVALTKLMDGNHRFATGRHDDASRSPQRRAELTQTQNPYAVIVSCSDSRVGPEVVFDQGLGEIFVIRTAGEVLDAPGLGSIEYAVEHLGSPLIVVLGHERCGAVAAAVAGGKAPGHIGALVSAILPAVVETKGQPGDHVDNAVRANVRRIVRQLKNSQPILAEFSRSGKVRIVGAYYDLETGVVTILR